MHTLGSHQLTSTSILEVDVTSNQTMLVISGIAIPEFASSIDGQVRSEKFKIELGVYAVEILQSSVTVGLCDITSVSGDFAFGTDEATVSLSDTGEISLIVTAQVLGISTLIRFSYQVVVLIKPVKARVTGTVKWDESLWNVAQTPPDVPPSVKHEVTIVVAKQVNDGGLHPGAAWRIGKLNHQFRLSRVRFSQRSRNSISSFFDRLDRLFFSQRGCQFQRSVHPGRSRLFLGRWSLDRQGELVCDHGVGGRSWRCAVSLPGLELDSLLPSASQESRAALAPFSALPS